MNVDRLLEALRTRLPGLPLQAERLPVDETCVTLPRDRLRPVVAFLVQQFGLTHLSAITGDDTGDEIVLLYHFWAGTGFTLRVALERDRPTIGSVQDLIPGALFYEREVAEMLGVRVEGCGDLEPLVLPDDWAGPPPMRRQEETAQ